MLAIALGLDRLTVSYHQVAMSVALTAGFLSSGVIAQRLSRRGVPTISVAGWGMIGLVAIEAVPARRGDELRHTRMAEQMLRIETVRGAALHRPEASKATSERST